MPWITRFWRNLFASKIAVTYFWVEKYQIWFWGACDLFYPLYFCGRLQYRTQGLFGVYVCSLQCRAFRLVCPGSHTPPSFLFILCHLDFDKFPFLALHLPPLLVFDGNKSLIALQRRLRGTLRDIVVVLLDPLVGLSRLSYYVIFVFNLLVVPLFLGPQNIFSLPQSFYLSRQPSTMIAE